MQGSERGVVHQTSLRTHFHYEEPKSPLLYANNPFFNFKNLQIARHYKSHKSSKTSANAPGFTFPFVKANPLEQETTSGHRRIGS